ncbi:FAD/NAD(P)-binding protein [Agrobacterium vitis]
MYLAEQMRALIRRGAASNVHIVPLQAEVQDIAIKDSGYIILTECGLTISASKVFLFCGTLSQKTGVEYNDARINRSPYPLADTLGNVRHHEDVGIIGARLSAIDTVIALVEAGHTGKIRLHSRSGYFPAVRGTQGRIVTQRLSPDGVRRLTAEKGALQLDDLVGLFMQEMQLHESSSGAEALPSLMPPCNIIEYLEKEIEAAQHPRLWQAVLYATNGFVEEIWRALSQQAQADFLSRHFSAFMACRVSIPVENAKRILDYLRDGRLEFVPGHTFGVTPSDDCLILRGDRQEYQYHRIIYAIGSPRDVEGVCRKPLQRPLLALLRCHFHILLTFVSPKRRASKSF